MKRRYRFRRRRSYCCCCGSCKCYEDRWAELRTADISRPTTNLTGVAVSPVHHMLSRLSRDYLAGCLEATADFCKIRCPTVGLFAL